MSTHYPRHDDDGSPSSIVLDFDTETLSASLESTPLVGDHHDVNAGHVENARGDGDGGGKLGTVMGVYAPVVTHLYGVLLFLRLGMAIGHSGTLLVVLMFAITYLTIVLTSLSVSAIATNGKVKGGGTYFLISRSIGAEFGGSIGIIFFCAKVFSITAGVIGFTDALLEAFPVMGHSYWHKLLYTSIALVLLAAVCFVGSSLFAKTSFLFFVILVACILLVAISFVFQSPDPSIGFTGWSLNTFVENLWPSFGVDQTTGNMLTFSAVLGIIYPACSAILGGVNLSGDLAKPQVSIPNGTLAAIFTSALTYLSLILLIAFTTAKKALISDLAIMSNVSYLPLMVNLGIMSTGLSAALGGIITSSKILQAIANDHLLPGIKVLKSKGEARRAYVVCYIMVQMTCLVGEINIIAPMITMFYLLCYTIINVACFALAISGAPNFRPLFKGYSWRTAAFGAISCLATMFLISPLYASISIVILLVLLVVIHLFAPAHQWGDISQALMYHQVRKYLLRLDNKKNSHVKFWRPQVLLFINNPRSSLPLISFVNYLKKGGLYVIGHIVQNGNSNATDSPSSPRTSSQGIHRLSPEGVQAMQDTENAWQSLITEKGFKAFTSVVMSNSFYSGAQNLISAAGMGNVKSNTIIMSFREKPDSTVSSLGTAGSPKAIQLFPDLDPAHHVELEEYLALINDCCLLGKNVIIARHFSDLDMRQLAPEKIIAKLTMQKHKFIDVWLPRVGPYRTTTTPATISLLLQYAFILKKSPGAFSKFHRLRVMSIVETLAQRKEEKEHLRELLYESRITNMAIDVMDLESYAVSQFDDEQTSMIDDNFERQMMLHRRINAVMSSNSDRSSVLFMPLPLPPEFGKETSSRDEHQKRLEEYMEKLTELTDNLPPCLLVNSNMDVISKDV